MNIRTWVTECIFCVANWNNKRVAKQWEETFREVQTLSEVALSHWRVFPWWRAFWVHTMFLVFLEFWAKFLHFLVQTNEKTSWTCQKLQVCPFLLQTTTSRLKFYTTRFWIGPHNFENYWILVIELLKL